MASKSESNPGGLFSKVVKFVRNPSTGWSGLDTPEEAAESGYSRQMLKEMIERKRRNDFVRKREFDMLRKLRRSEAIAGNDPAARPSFFLSSMPSRPDDRASTLKKIDEIEAQMSQQWWKSKGVEPTRTELPTSIPSDMKPPPVRSSQPPGSDPRIPAAVRSAPIALAPAPAQSSAPMDLGLELDLPGPDFGTVEPAARAGSTASASPAPSASSAADKVTNAFASTMQPGEPSASEWHLLEPAAAQLPPLPADPLGGMPAAGPSPQAPLPSWMAGSEPLPLITSDAAAAGAAKPSASRPAARLAMSLSDREAGVEAVEYESDPELEDAAIRFASGDDAGAEAALRGLIAPGANRNDHADTWLALFDLYRALEMQDRFDELASEFAGRFGRSAPQWRAASSGSHQPTYTISQAATLPVASAQRGIDWASPASLGLQSVATLQATMARTPIPWRISWARLATIEDAAVAALSRLFTQWATQPLQIRFVGTEALERVLQARTPSGDASVDPGWWRLRMDALRLMNRADDFEIAALDYCVSYEVSPPSWEPPRCDFRTIEADAAADAIGAQSPAEAADSVGGFEPSMITSRLPRPVHAELTGTLEGDIDGLLRKLAPAAGTDHLLVSCATLARVDFSAAGSLLNWAAARTGDGCEIHFSDVHRLVGAFFAVVGINGLARLTLRRD